jgi:4-aminobutyrate aminotransferase-like enzyme/Ser/Thr protein kinase RdoA (MazF antagonist)
MLLEARTKHQTTTEEAERFAAELYGLRARATALPGEYDDNFCLTASDARQFVLKVMHPAREAAFVDMQCRALEHLARTVPQLGLPRVISTSAGRLHTNIPSADGTERLVWALTYVPGHVLANVHPHASDLLEDLGRFLGELDRGLADFSHPATRRELKWNSLHPLWIREYIIEIADPNRRALVERFLRAFEAEVLPNAARLRHSVIYGDANDHNVLVSDPWPQPRRVVSVIDFGDMHHGAIVSEVAIAAAYAILGKADPLAAASAVVRGFHRACPLEEGEIAALYTLIGMRLAVSVTNSAHRKKVKPEDAYVMVSEAPAWEALERWDKIHPRFAHYTFRDACGFEPMPNADAMRRTLSEFGRGAASIVAQDLRREPVLVFDLSVGSTFLGADPREGEAALLAEKESTAMREAGASVGVGRYNEPRLLYTSPLYGAVGRPTDERRTIHLGIDLCGEAGAPIRAPLDGTVHGFANNRAGLDYGPVVILEHTTAEDQHFYTLYGHLTTETLTKLHVGQTIRKGEAFGCIGKTEENGGWAPHVHFQVILDLLDWGTDFPGVCRASQRNVYTSVSPDPNLLLGIPAERFPAPARDAQETLATRRKLLGKNLSISYEKPLKIVRGWMQYLYDDTGRAYLDFYNNVPLVGHSHPLVVKAAQEQLALVNTNTRYLHDTVIEYAERLAQLLPEPLRVCFFVNSGTEANELALRLARAHTKREDVIVLEHAYHGHTTTLIDVSPYKSDGPGGTGKKPWVHVAPLPDDYRGRYRRDNPRAGEKYAAHVAEILQQLQRDDRAAAAFLAETMPSVGGQIVFPPGYLAEAYKHLRTAGAVCIADEVQVGFGRLGTRFWGFETQDVVPEIVVLGKPIGNGFPLAAVVTTPEIAASFANGMEFFSTFGGNPVACAAGLAVLDVLRDENLQQNALEVGNFLLTGLAELQNRYASIGDVRGSGLFLGVDFVRNRERREPAPAQASYVVNRLREKGVLTGTDGPHHNVLKLRPPLMIHHADAQLFLDLLGEVLAEDPAQA